jgi:hypothetical protein
MLLILIRHLSMTNKLSKLYLLVCSLFLFDTLCPIQAMGAMITTADGDGADTYIRSNLFNNAANVNYGSSSVLAIKHDTGLSGNNRKGYIRFDLSSINTQFNDSRLHLAYLGDHPDSQSPSVYNIYGLNDEDPNENWNESSITWNTAPGNNTGSAGGVEGNSTVFLGTLTLTLSGLSAGDSVSFSSPDLLTFLQADTNDLVTFIITRQQRNFGIETFASKENIDFSPPMLELTTIPIPATALLFVSGLFGIFGTIRKRGVL